MKILTRHEFFNNGKLLGKSDEEVIQNVKLELERQKIDRVPIHHCIVTVIDEADEKVFLNGAKFGSNGNVMWIPDRLVPQILDVVADKLNNIGRGY